MQEPVEKEIAEFLSNDFLEPKAEESPKEEPVVVKEETHEEEAEPEKGTEEPPKEEEPEAKVESKEDAEEGGEEEPTLEFIQAENARLRALIEEGKVVEVAPTEEVKAPAPEEIKLDPIDFLTDLDRLDPDADDYKEKLNMLLNKVRMKTHEEAVNMATERVLRAIPELVMNYSRKNAGIQKMVDEFYDKNSDLTSYKRTVGEAANKVYAEHPDWKYPAIFEEAGRSARKTLGLKARALKEEAKEETGTKSKKSTPPFAGAKGTKRGSDSGKLKGMAKEIDDILSDL
jgi:hypothetical protein